MRFGGSEKREVVELWEKGEDKRRRKVVDVSEKGWEVGGGRGC